jgi:hypothetical protein
VSGISVAEIVVSFNRPTMLREALTSVAAADPDQLIVVDDGSLFDVPAVCAAFPVTDYVFGPPMSVDTRMTTPRQGRLINEALRLVRCDVATLLCDDDLRAEGWYETLRAHWTIEPRAKLIRGRWLLFYDDETPALNNPPSPMCQARKMTAGNFAWRADLTRGDRPRCRWPVDRLNCLDDGFLWSLQQARVDTFNVASVGLAGWRREHPLVNNNFSTGKDHTEAFRAVLAAGFLEAAR